MSTRDGEPCVLHRLLSMKPQTIPSLFMSDYYDPNRTALPAASFPAPHPADAKFISRRDSFVNCRRGADYIANPSSGGEV